MANKLHTSGGKVRKMYITYNGLLRLIKYAFYNTDKVYACFEPPVITGVLVFYKYTTLKTTNHEAEVDKEDYVLAEQGTTSYTSSTFTATIPAYECTITSIKLCWTLTGPDTDESNLDATDAGTRGQYYDIINDLNIIPSWCKEEGNPKYATGYSVTLKTYTNLQKSVSYSTDNNKIKIVVNDETSEKEITIAIKRASNSTTDGTPGYIPESYDASNLPTPTLYHGYSTGVEYTKHSVSISCSSGTITLHLKEYPSTYLEADKSETKNITSFLVSTDGSSWSSINGSSYSVPTETYHKTDVGPYTYYFRGIITAFYKDFYTPSVTFILPRDVFTEGKTTTEIKYGTEYQCTSYGGNYYLNIGETMQLGKASCDKKRTYYYYYSYTYDEWESTGLTNIRNEQNSERYYISNWITCGTNRVEYKYITNENGGTVSINSNNIISFTPPTGIDNKYTNESIRVGYFYEVIYPDDGTGFCSFKGVYIYCNGTKKKETTNP